MFIQLILTTFNLLLLLFLPGYLLTLVVFTKKEINPIERLFLSITISIAASITLGIILSFSKSLWDIAALTKFNLIFALLFICFVCLVLIIRQKSRKQPHK